MYKVNDFVFHHSEGLCKVLEIRDVKRANGEIAPYYILEPLFSPHETTLMIPVSRGEQLLREPLTTAEAEQLINIVSELEPIELSQKKIRTLQTLSELSNYSHREIIAVIKGLVLKEQSLIAKRKTLPITQKRVLKSAEKLLYDQLAIALSIPRDEVDEKFRTLIIKD